MLNQLLAVSKLVCSVEVTEDVLIETNFTVILASISLQPLLGYTSILQVPMESILWNNTEG